MNGRAFRQIFEIPVVGSAEMLRIPGFQQNDLTVEE